MGDYLITMPDIGEGIAEVEIVEWQVKVGDQIKEDDVLCVAMTDKAAVEIPSPVDGEVLWLGPDAGTVMAVGADLVKLQIEGEADTKESDTKEGGGAIPKRAVDSELTANAPPGKHIKPAAAPTVRLRARSAGVDLHQLTGTGPSGRITHQDLDAYIAAPGGAAKASSDSVADTSVQEIKVMGLRRRIAAVMQDTMQRIPHYTYVEEIDVSELEALRSKLNHRRRQDQPKLTLLPFFMRALVRALREYPQMSSRYDDEAEIVRRYGAAHIGIATQTPSGLLVPVIKHAETLDIWQSAGEIKHLAELARAGKANRDQLSGSTITITSLGPMGGIATTPVINAPEVAIIGINKVTKRPHWQDGGFVPRDMMNLSSSFDHRIIDGWEATQFIHCIKDLLEAPALLFMEG